MKTYRRQSLLIAFVALTSLFVLTGLLEAASSRPRRPVVKPRAKPLSPATSAHAGPQPLPGGPKAYTERDYALVRLKWRQKITDDAYVTVGRRSPTWDGEATNLVRAYTLWAADQPGARDIKQVLTAARPLMQSDCDDPLVLYAIGCALHEDGQATVAEPYLRRAVEGYQAVPYPKATAWTAPYRLARICESAGGEKAREAGKWFDLAIAWIAQAACEGSWQGAERRAFYGAVRAALYDGLNGRAEQLSQAVAAKAGADVWLAELFAGESRVIEAWKLRGRGFTDTVTPAGWRGFSEELPPARAHFVKAWKLHPEFPEAAERMIEVSCMAGADAATLRTWFDRAVAAQFDYQPAYQQYTWYGLMERWGGSHRQMCEFGRECLATKRFDTAVPNRMWQVVYAIAVDDAAPSIWRAPGIYRDLRTLFAGYAAEPANAAEVHQIKTRQAAMAWRCGAYDDARKLLDELGSNLALGGDGGKVFDSVNATPPAWALGEIYAATGPLAADVRKAEAFYQAGNPSAAAAVFKRVAKDNTDTRADSYLRMRVETCRIEAGLQTDQWVALGTSLDVWRTDSGQWEQGSDGAIMALKPQGWQRLVCPARMPRNFEVRAQVEVQSTGSNLEGAVVCGFNQMRHHRDYVVVSAGGFARLNISGDSGQRQYPQLGERNLLTAQVWDSQLTAYVCGQFIGRDREFEFKLDPSQSAQVALGAYGRGSGDATVVFRDVQVRALRRPPSPPAVQPSDDAAAGNVKP